MGSGARYMSGVEPTTAMMQPERPHVAGTEANQPREIAGARRQYSTAQCTGGRVDDKSPIVHGELVLCYNVWVFVRFTN